MISDSFPNNNGKTHRAEVSRLCFTEFLFRGLSGCLTYGDDYELLLSGLQQRISQNSCPGFDTPIEKELSPLAAVDTWLGCGRDKPSV